MSIALGPDDPSAIAAAGRQLARFLAGLDPDFQLLETMRVTRSGMLRHAERHLARMERSAATLGFRFDRQHLGEALAEGLNEVASGVVSWLRCTLAHDGRIEVASAPLLPLPDGRVDVLIEPEPLLGLRPLAGHKTTLRGDYDAAVRRAEARGAYDSLFFTADGRMVEGGHSNVFVLLDGRWWTPPLSDGALPGVMRSLLLDDPAWQAGERTLRLSDVRRARSLMICNSLRGALPGQLVIDP